MDFNWPWPDAFSTLKPNFIEIGWKMNSGQLSDLQFACKDESKPKSIVLLRRFKNSDFWSIFDTLESEQNESIIFPSGVHETFRIPLRPMKGSSHLL